MYVPMYHTFNKIKSISLWAGGLKQVPKLLIKSCSTA
jgi:hypothetical protein